MPTALPYLWAFIKVAHRITAPSEWLFPHRKRRNPLHRLCMHLSTAKSMPSPYADSIKTSRRPDASRPTQLHRRLQLIYIDQNGFTKSIASRTMFIYLPVPVSMIHQAFAHHFVLLTQISLHQHSVLNLTTPTQLLFGLFRHTKSPNVDRPAQKTLYFKIS